MFYSRTRQTHAIADTFKYRHISTFTFCIWWLLLLLLLHLVVFRFCLIKKMAGNAEQNDTFTRHSNKIYLSCLYPTGRQFIDRCGNAAAHSHSSLPEHCGGIQAHPQLFRNSTNWNEDSDDACAYCSKVVTLHTIEGEIVLAAHPRSHRQSHPCNDVAVTPAHTHWHWWNERGYVRALASLTKKKIRANSRHDTKMH